jgi:ribonuclease HI
MDIPVRLCHQWAWQKGTCMSAPNEVIIYTDGACTGNPGPGGYGVVLLCAGKRRELAAGFRLTTNNRMEIMAAIAGLRALKYPCTVTLFTDSRYLADAITKGWARKWRANGWQRSDGQPALNSDLWQQLLELLEGQRVTFVWVRGHDGTIENERCDQLAVAAAHDANLLVDDGYENKPLPEVAEPGVAQPTLLTESE